MYNQYIVWCFFVFKIKQNAQRKEVTKLCAFEHQLKLAQEINGVTLGKRFLGFRFSKKKKAFENGVEPQKNTHI
jgi:hypothetical protein